jgi:DNA-directed RNA polymerase sigma subunit (sigma70/sigma32)
LENLPDKRDSTEAKEFPPGSLANTVNQLMSSLSEREQMVVAARFGLQGQPRGQSLAAIAEQIGLCKERVRQILIQSLAKLRSSILAIEPDPDR